MDTKNIIAQIESGNNPLALRYEPAWRYFSAAVTQRCMSAHKCDLTTARTLLAFSYGKFQIMGQVIYELGFNGNLITDFLMNEKEQELFFNEFISKRDIKYETPALCYAEARRDFARKYNGPGNIERYSFKIERALVAAGYVVLS